MPNERISCDGDVAKTGEELRKEEKGQNLAKKVKVFFFLPFDDFTASECTA